MVSSMWSPLVFFCPSESSSQWKRLKLRINNISPPDWVRSIRSAKYDVFTCRLKSLISKKMSKNWLHSELSDWEHDSELGGKGYTRHQHNRRHISIIIIPIRTLGSTVIHFTGCSAVGSPGTPISNFQWTTRSPCVKRCQRCHVHAFYTQKTEWMSESANQTRPTMRDQNEKKSFPFFRLRIHSFGSIWWIKTNFPPFRRMNERRTHSFTAQNSRRRAKTDNRRLKSEQLTRAQIMPRNILHFSHSHLVGFDVFRRCIRKGKFIREWNEWEVHSFCV